MPTISIFARESVDAPPSAAARIGAHPATASSATCASASTRRTDSTRCTGRARYAACARTAVVGEAPTQAAVAAPAQAAANPARHATKLAALAAAALAALSLAVLLSPLGAQPAQAEPVSEHFPDVAEDGWYYADVQWVYDNGIMSGYGSSGLFGVGAQLTRAEFACILANHAGVDTTSRVDTTGIRDIAAGGQWYTGAVNWAVENGVIVGYGQGDERTFGPNDPVTREMAMTILARYAGFEESDAVAVPDMPDISDVSDWALPSVAWALENGIVSGATHQDGTTWVEPRRNVLREEAAKMVHGTAAYLDNAGEDPAPAPGDDPTPGTNPSTPTEPTTPVDPIEPTPDPTPSPDPNPNPDPDPAPGPGLDNNELPPMPIA